jgi:hypothetical protein
MTLRWPCSSFKKSGASQIRRIKTGKNRKIYQKFRFIVMTAKNYYRQFWDNLQEVRAGAGVFGDNQNIFPAKAPA